MSSPMSCWKKVSIERTRGAFMFNENGILFPYSAVHTDVFAGMKTYDVDNIEMAQLNLVEGTGDTFSIYCDGEGAINGKHMHNNTFGRTVCGPLFFVGYDESTETEPPTTWLRLSKAIANTHHVCGWPLTHEEKNKAVVSVHIESKDLLNRIVPFSIVEKVWSDNEQYYHATLLDHKPIGIDEVCVKGTHSRCGSIVQRATIPDPRYPYPGPLIETVALTLLTVEGDKHRPMAIAHFLRDGTLVRAQVNCFAMGIVADDGYYIAEYADELEDSLESAAEINKAAETKRRINQ